MACLSAIVCFKWCCPSDRDPVSQETNYGTVTPEETLSQDGGSGLQRQESKYGFLGKKGAPPPYQGATYSTGAVGSDSNPVASDLNATDKNDRSMLI